MQALYNGGLVFSPVQRLLAWLQFTDCRHALRMAPALLPAARINRFGEVWRQQASVTTRFKFRSAHCGWPLCW